MLTFNPNVNNNGSNSKEQKKSNETNILIQLTKTSIRTNTPFSFYTYVTAEEQQLLQNNPNIPLNDIKGLEGLNRIYTNIEIDTIPKLQSNTQNLSYNSTDNLFNIDNLPPVLNDTQQLLLIRQYLSYVNKPEEIEEQKKY